MPGIEKPIKIYIFTRIGEEYVVTVRVSRSMSSSRQPLEPSLATLHRVSRRSLPISSARVSPRMAVAFSSSYWAQYDERGNRSHVLTTYHNVSDGWYLTIPESWRDQMSIKLTTSMARLLSAKVLLI